jgi:16S rRNA (guanine966-N2)-methyltransferase
MRIIAGTKRGMKLFSPPPLLRFAKQSGGGSRPVLDRVKESVFNILYKYNMPEGKTVADLFCGVGSFGLEAISRGAKFVTFVEKNPKVADVLKKNIAKADFAGQSKVVIADAFKVGASPDAAGSKSAKHLADKYDLVFVDPPYILTEDVGEKSPLFGLLNKLENQTTSDSLVLVRTHFEKELLENYGIFHTIERRHWGTMAVTFLGRK